MVITNEVLEIIKIVLNQRNQIKFFTIHCENEKDREINIILLKAYDDILATILQICILDNTKVLNV